MELISIEQNDLSASSSPAGLTSQEAMELLALHSFNELSQAKRKSLLSIIAAVFREPMFLLLASSSAIYLLIGDLEEAIFLIASFIVILAITIYQENKTEHALEALKDLSSPRALVIRDGQQIRVPGREVVPEIGRAHV